MIYLLIQLSIWLILALILGVAIGWWLWHRKLQLSLERNERLESDADAANSQMKLALADVKNAEIKSSEQKGALVAFEKELEANEKHHADALGALRDELALLKKELKQANKEKQDALSANAGLKEGQAQMSDSLKSLQAQHVELKGLHDVSLEQLGEAKGALEPLTQQVKQLRGQVSAKDASIDTLEQKLKQNEDLSLQLTKANTKYEELHAIYEEQSNAVERMQHELHGSKEQSAGRAAELALLGATLASQKGKYDEVDALLGSLREENAGLREELASLKSEKLQGEDTRKDLLAQLKQREGTFAEELEGKDKLHAEYVHTLRGELDQLKKELKQSTKEKQDSLIANAALQEGQTQLGQALSEVNAQHAELKTQHSASLEQLGEAKGALEPLTQQVKQLRGQVSAKDASIDALEQKLKQANKEKQDALSANAGLKEGQAQMSDSLKSLQAQHVELKGLHDVSLEQLGEAKGALEPLTQQMKQLRTQLGSKDAELKVQAQELAKYEDLTVQLATSKAQYEELHGIYEAQSDSVERLQHDLHTSKSQAAGRAAELAVLGTTLATAHSQHKEARSLLETLNEDNAVLREELARLSSEMQQSKETHEGLLSQLKQQEGAQEQLQALRVEFSGLEQEHEQCDRWRVMATGLEQQLSEAHQTIKAQEEQFKTLLAQHDHTQQTIASIITQQREQNTHLVAFGKAHEHTHSQTELLIECHDSLNHQTGQHLEELLALVKRPADKAPSWFMSFTEHNNYQEKYVSLSADHERLKKNHQSVVGELDALKQAQQHGTQEHAQLLAVAQEELKASHDVLHAQRAEVEALQLALMTSQEQCKACEEQLQKEQEQVVLVDTAPAAEWTPPPLADSSVQADELQRIKGIGPVLETTLHDLGYRTFEQLAQWGVRDIEYVTKQLDCFPDRIVRDEWVRQAGEFAAED